jgi:hypothetical protein
MRGERSYLARDDFYVTTMVGLHSLLRAAAVRAPRALEVHFLSGTRILST